MKPVHIAAVLIAWAAGCGRKPSQKAGKATFDAAKLAQIAATQVPGYRQKMSRVIGRQAEMRYESEAANAQGANVAAQVVMSGCMGCLPMTVAAWQSRVEDLKSKLAGSHKNNPELVFQISELDMGGGRKAIAVYHLSFLLEGGGPGTAHGFTVHYNDGTNALMIVTYGRGGPVAMTREELERRVSKAELEASARAIFTALVPHFGS